MINRRKFILGSALVAAGTSGCIAARRRFGSTSTTNSVSGKTAPADIHRLVQFGWETVFQDEPLLSGVTPLLEKLQLSDPVSALKGSSAGKHKTLAFGGERSLGAVVWTDWGDGPLPPQLGWEQDPSITEHTHAGKTLYRADELAAARLDGGAIGIGTESTVDTLLERWSETVTEAAGVVSTHTAASREADIRFSIKDSENTNADQLSLDQRTPEVYGSIQRADEDIRAKVNLNMKLPEQTDAVVSDIESTVVQLLCSANGGCDPRRAGDEIPGFDTNRRFGAADIEYRATADEFPNDGETVLRGILRGMTEGS